MSREINKNTLGIVKNYRDNDLMRKSFNNLAMRTFGIGFEPWYQMGCWTDNYQPYSIVDGDQAVANVSVNLTNMLYNGRKLHLIQLGTVMTDPDQIICSFGREVKRVALGFTPLCTNGYLCSEIEGEDRTFFIKGV